MSNRLYIFDNRKIQSNPGYYPFVLRDFYMYYIMTIVASIGDIYACVHSRSLSIIHIGDARVTGGIGGKDANDTK